MISAGGDEDGGDGDDGGSFGGGGGWFDSWGGGENPEESLSEGLWIWRVGSRMTHIPLARCNCYEGGGMH